MAAASRTKVLRPAAALLVGLFLFMPFFFMHYFFAHPPRYPVSARELPEGVSLFLKEHHAAGALLNHPNSGGYLQWVLYPQCRIFMDMQVPFLFTDADFAAARGVYVERPALRKIIDRYRPAFITVPIEMEGFRSMIVEHPQYRMVFFDDAEVLYVDSAQERALAETYEIRSIDPFTLYREPMGPRLTGGPALDELKRLAGIFPAGGIVNASLAAYFLSVARYREAIACAEAVIRTYPESHLGYKLKADALARLDRCREAMQCYTKALQRSDGELRTLIEREAASCSGRLRTGG
jgi:tetratricopeptide (TPR) repeat protein